MKIKILASAVGDLMDGRFFYERQGEGVGSYFFDFLFSDIDSLVLYAGIHQKFGAYHRLLAKRFPYAVYYTLDHDLVLVAERQRELTFSKFGRILHQKESNHESIC